jgi:hypothetical protein
MRCALAPASSSDRRRRLRAAAGRGLLAAAALVCTLTAASAPAEAKVFYAKDEALELAFPDADSVKPRDFYLTSEQKTRIEELATAPVSSSLLTVYEGRKEGAVTGYAIFDTHIVRTLPETFLVVLAPDGNVRATHVLAFYEPTDYLPSDRWLDLFKGRTPSEDLQVGRGIAAITGSTLSTRAVTSGIRRALAIHAVLLGGNE